MLGGSLDDSQWLSVTLFQSSLHSEESKAVILDPLLYEYYHLFAGDLLQVSDVGNLDLFRLGCRWVVYVDIVGSIRSVYETQKCSVIEVDDGTGCVTCTVWHDAPSRRQPNASQSSVSVEYERVCDQLFRMARSQQPVHSGSCLRLGQMIHLRGRLKRFRGKVKLSASFSRIITEPTELFSQMLHRKKLKSDVYSRPYDPEHIAKHLFKSLSLNCVESVLEEIRQILLEDNLHTFTKRDLCLNTRVLHALSTTANPVAFDDAESVYLTSHSGLSETSEALIVNRLVDDLIEHLQKDGWIYPASEPIGQTRSFHTAFGDRLLVDNVYDAIRIQNDVESGVSIRDIIKMLRRRPDCDWTHVSWPVVRRILEDLETDSRIYQVDQNHYRIA